MFWAEVSVLSGNGPARTRIMRASWTRSILQSADGRATRFDVMRPDGSDRRRFAGANETAVSADVAFLDRFEVLTGLLWWSTGAQWHTVDLRGLAVR